MEGTIRNRTLQVYINRISIYYHSYHVLSPYQAYVDLAESIKFSRIQQSNIEHCLVLPEQVMTQISFPALAGYCPCQVIHMSQFLLFEICT